VTRIFRDVILYLSTFNIGFDVRWMMEM